MTPFGQTLRVTAMETIIDVRDISKWFGSVVAVNDVLLQVSPGITGLLGPNGAGKTTLLHMIAGLAKPSQGEVKLLGELVRDNPRLYRRVGVMSEHKAVYGFYTGHQFVEFATWLHGLSPLAPAVDRAIEAIGLRDVQNRQRGRDYAHHHHGVGRIGVRERVGGPHAAGMPPTRRHLRNTLAR